MKNIRTYLAGFLTGSLFFSGIAFAATQQITVDTQPIKFMVDGRLQESNASFLYNGVPYVPASFVGEKVGRQVTWDAKNSTITIGRAVAKVKAPIRLSSLPYSMPYGLKYSHSYTDNWKTGKFSVGGKTYLNGIGYDYVHEVADDKLPNSTCQVFSFQLNGKYSKLSGILATDDKSSAKQDTVLWRITGDDQVLFESGEQKAGMSQMADVDLTGVKTLTIEIRRLTENEKKKDIWAFFGNALLQ
ncbi:NPCBM/NEW2 domain-containing protein [Brevibacillus ginsengisoli]|uniref:NPCBM/NEW2 domain-containing protein n=1 Tax=Brevibacillus ginsengisoli TaxID=363854 RepID=UPI003CE6ACE1